MGVDETELAWAAGFFDGEGCVTGFVPRYGEFQLQVIIGQSNTTEALERFRDAVGLGVVTGPYEREGKSPHFHWNASGKRGHAVMALLRPYLCSPKIEKYDYIVEYGCLPAKGPDTVRRGA